LDKIFERALIYGLCAPTVVDPRWQHVPEHLKDIAIAYRLAGALICVATR